jgi:hypothetical protein
VAGGVSARSPCCSEGDADESATAKTLEGWTGAGETAALGTDTSREASVGREAVVLAPAESPAAPAGGGGAWSLS